MTEYLHIIYCNLTNYFKTWLLKTTDTYFLTLLWVRNLEVASLSDSGSGSPVRLQVISQPGLRSPEHSAGASVPRWLTPLPTGKRSQFLTGYWQKASGFWHMGFSIGLLERTHDMAAGFPQSKSYKKAKGSPDVYYHLASEVTFHHFHNIL